MGRQICLACRVGAVVFGIVCGLHLWRLIARVEVIIGTWAVPLGISVVGMLVSGALAWWLWRSSRRCS